MCPVLSHSQKLIQFYVLFTRYTALVYCNLFLLLLPTILTGNLSQKRVLTIEGMAVGLIWKTWVLLTYGKFLANPLAVPAERTQNPCSKAKE